ncbi:MAG: phytanoyl-CoA dioxygenase family protein [Lentisphaeria bacterium]|nr:phytanoyl-CoA dioxygenase family protein [Lentisphaeria bacterium]
MTDWQSKRDLRFTDVKTDAPKKISHEQIADYNHNGFISGLAIFSETEARDHLDFFDTLMQENNQNGNDGYAINGYQTACKDLWDICTNSRILDTVEDIIGPDIICWGTHFFCKMPYDTKHVPWHQDASYWPLTPSNTVTAWLAIDDVDEENSAMCFIPGTHRLGHLDWKTSNEDAVLSREITQIDSYGKPFSNNLKAGQISLHADMLAHGSSPNTSARRRCGLTIRYAPPTVVPLTNWGKNAIICRGEDPSGNWTDNPRPESNSLDPNHLNNIFGEDMGQGLGK